ncbi:MAG: winged helix-turn-helix domain-containing protein [Anaerolineae bacterium]|nr:winged helix-turn-helix domain-containing protein [Anaerolineae bacterium]
MENVPRPQEENCLAAYLGDGRCCAVVGLSNTGKSAFLRRLSRQEVGLPAPGGQGMSLFYVDCNRMLSLSEQGFYEAILRAIRSTLGDWMVESGLAEHLEEDYQRIIDPRNPLAVPLGFNNALERLCDASRRVVLILDEFDKPFETLKGRIFLNLRALRDRYRDQLVYVTSTVRNLERVRDDPESAEFRELFAGHVCVMGMLEEASARKLVSILTAKEEICLSEEEVDFVLRSTGGHPGLLNGVVRLFVRARTAAPKTYERMGIALVDEAMVGDEVIRGECERLWEQLTDLERDHLLELAQGQSASDKGQQSLRRMGVIDDAGAVFAAVFAAFVERLSGRWQDQLSGIWLDEDAGEVYADGKRLPTLTGLEYRLLRALYARKDRLCDKYRIVEEVWGESYLDDVDDARVEKLISRVRAKIEPDPSNPRYLVTVRGRGYRLQGSPSSSDDLAPLASSNG